MNLTALAAPLLLLATAGCAASPAVLSECMSYGRAGCALTVYYRPATQACWYAPVASWQAPPSDVQVGCYELAVKAVGCLAGWRGKWQDSPEEAVAEWREHQRS